MGGNAQVSVLESQMDRTGNHAGVYDGQDSKGDWKSACRNLSRAFDGPKAPETLSAPLATDILSVLQGAIIDSEEDLLLAKDLHDALEPHALWFLEIATRTSERIQVAAMGAYLCSHDAPAVRVLFGLAMGRQVELANVVRACALVYDFATHIGAKEFRIEATHSVKQLFFTALLPRLEKPDSSSDAVQCLRLLEPAPVELIEPLWSLARRCVLDKSRLRGGAFARAGNALINIFKSEPNPIVVRDFLQRLSGPDPTDASIAASMLCIMWPTHKKPGVEWYFAGCFGPCDLNIVGVRNSASGYNRSNFRTLIARQQAQESRKETRFHQCLEHDHLAPTFESPIFIDLCVRPIDGFRNIKFQRMFLAEVIRNGRSDFARACSVYAFALSDQVCHPLTRTNADYYAFTRTALRAIERSPSPLLLATSRSVEQMLGAHACREPIPSHGATNALDAEEKQLLEQLAQHTELLASFRRIAMRYSRSEDEANDILLEFFERLETHPRDLRRMRELFSDPLAEAASNAWTWLFERRLWDRWRRHHTARSLPEIRPVGDLIENVPADSEGALLQVRGLCATESDEFSESIYELLNENLSPERWVQLACNRLAKRANKRNRSRLAPDDERAKQIWDSLWRPRERAAVVWTAFGMQRSELTSSLRMTKTQADHVIRLLKGTRTRNPPRTLLP
jgi:hypothetical protein